MEEKVSIIIPVYRAADLVEKCVRSLCEGSYQNLEILLLEDGSPDDSLAVCRSLEEKYPQVKVFANEKNLGVSATRNRGLQEMTGKYLLFVDSDDWVEPEYVEKLINAHARYASAMTVCGYINHDEMQSGRADIFGFDGVEGEEERPLKESLMGLYEGRLLQQIWNKLFLADIIRDNCITFDPSIRMGEDFRFLLTYLRFVKKDSVTLVNRALYHYNRCIATSAMFRVGTESIEEPLKNLRALYKLIGENEETIEERIERDRESMIRGYAYMIVHNRGMKWKEKKRLIYALDAERGKMLYRTNKTLYYKEKLMRFIKKITKNNN